MSIHDLVAPKNTEETVVLDGAIGTEIKRRSGLPGSSDLAVSVMVQSPQIVRTLHEDYIKAGAQVITANTYDSNRPALEKINVDAGQVAGLTIQAVEIAKEARARAAQDREVYIAGSLGPLGSDYDPDDVPSYNECLSVYLEQVKAMAASGVDLVLVETVARFRSARAGVAAAVEHGLPAWASLLADAKGRVRSGESLIEAAETLADDGASAILVNCTQPEDVTLAVRELTRQKRLPVGAYAQAAIYSGKGWEFGPSIPPTEYLHYARQWVDSGVNIVGGCCGTTPEHIRELKAHLRKGITP